MKNASSLDHILLGGGSYIGKDGKLSQLPATAIKVELPPDALPSGTEFDRQLEAITISNGIVCLKLFLIS